MAKFIKFSPLILTLVLLCGISRSQNIDINLLHSINKNESAIGDKSFKFLTKTVTPISFGAPLGLFLTGWINQDKTMQHNSYTVGGSVLISSLISVGLKYSVNRTRPYVDYPYPFINKKTEEQTPSFPSGHTTAAFATATSLSLAYPKWYIVLPSYLWAGSVAYSRMYLGVHYPSDILGGIIIGVGSSFLVWKGQQWLEKKK